MEAFPFQFRDTPSPKPLQLYFQQEDPWGRAALLSWKLPTQLLPVCSAPHGLLCSCALGKALINARRRTPTATSGSFLAAKTKSQVLWPGRGCLPRVTPLLKTFYAPHGPLDRGRVLSVRSNAPCVTSCGPWCNGGPPNSVFVWEHKPRSTFEER